MSHVPDYLKGRGRGRGFESKSQSSSNVGRGRGYGSSDQKQPSFGRGRGPDRRPGANYSTISSGRGYNGNQPREDGHGAGPETRSVGRGSYGRGSGGAGDQKQNWARPKEAENIRENGADYKSAEAKFQEVSNQHQESIQRHLGEEEDKGDNSSSDEDDIGTGVLEKVFHTYSTTNDTDTGTARDSLLHSFRSGTSACLVCIDNIRKNDPIWCCDGCYAMFHIQCIQKWVKDGVYQQVYRSEDDNIKTEDIPWHCPKCRLEYSQKRAPSRYLCFCGKVEEPKFDPWLVPHSCGQTCGQALKPDCGHTCLLLCHPGACPPCPQTVREKCYCGNSTPVVRRCSAREWACGNVCGRMLMCGQHRCQQACHAGECKPCPKTSSQTCLCGKSRAVRPCATAQWQCEKMCGRRLSCGNHLCEEMCHSGNCGPCPRGGARKCPCGKTTYDLPCTEDIPTCGDTCDKLLECNLHRCVQRCHQGPCGACRQMTMKKCRCATQKEKEVPCHKEYLCETKCSKNRDCRKHQCKRKCCDGNCPSCEQMCNKPLKCKNHKCASRCHTGPCYPCHNTVEITCFCKATRITVACGAERTTRPPKCNLKCKLPPICHHPSQIPHRCHFSDCPPCRQVCSKPMPNCSHTCPFMCHAAVKVKVKDNIKRAGPWEAGPKVTESIVNKPCPPCSVPLPMQCYGKHVTETFACSVIRPYQCGRACGRELACGNHTCQRMCHVVEGADSPTGAGSDCQECEEACQFDRPEGCNHVCTKPCHSGPCPQCTQMFRMRCHCQTIVRHVECYKWVNAGTSQRTELKGCGGPCPKLLSCGHPCSLVCHPGNCSSPAECERKVTLRCKCRRQKRETKCREREADQAKLACDDVCKQEQQKKRQKEQEAEDKKKEEEEKKKKAEVEEFERKMKGRKRKPRKHHEEIVVESFFQKNKKLLIVGVSLVALAAFVAYILNIN